MSGSQQFKREYELVIDTLKITKDDLRISFTIVRDLSEVPNTATISVYGLNPDHRAHAQIKQRAKAQLKAGYEGHSGVIFLGEIRSSSSVYERVDWITTFESGDAEQIMGESRINKTYSKGTDYATIIQEVAESMGDVGLGNLRDLVGKTKKKKAAKSLTVSGPSRKELDRLLISAGLQWSIQNHQFQILEANKTLNTQAVVLTPNTGLLGSPVADVDGTIKITCLLNPEIVPGRQVKVESKHVSGFYRCEKVTYQGDIEGEWVCNIEGVLIKQ